MEEFPETSWWWLPEEMRPRPGETPGAHYARVREWETRECGHPDPANRGYVKYVENK